MLVMQVLCRVKTLIENYYFTIRGLIEDQQRILLKLESFVL